MKNYYYAATIEQNGKYNSFVLEVGESDNLISVLKTFPSAKFMNACSSRKEATRIVEAWNRDYKKNGMNLF